MKVKSPLFSNEARGSLSEALTFSKRRSGQQVRYQKKQRDVVTAARTAQRALFLDSVERWNTRDYGIFQCGFSFFGMDIDQFEKKGTELHMTGYNFFIKDFLLFGE